MKKIAMILTLLTACLTFAFGQTATDSISMKKGFGGYQFYKVEKRLNMNQLVYAMKSNEQAFSQIKKALSNYTLASITTPGCCRSSPGSTRAAGWSAGAATDPAASPT
jgi:hypothetical protein